MTRPTIRTTPEQRAKVLQGISEPNAAWNEVLWTYLVADILSKSPHRSELLRRFCGGDPVATPESLDIWFEGKPLPPRKGTRAYSEGASHLDLALGGIGLREKTESGIEYAPTVAPWACFVEAKLLSDASTTVTYDPTRNQLARVIESLLCFQGGGLYPEKLYFVLLTPRSFRDRPGHRHSRLYGYKMDEYVADPGAILRDIGLCPFEERVQPAWAYPALEERLAHLKIVWMSFEEIIESEPEFGGKSLDLVKTAMSGNLPVEVSRRLERLSEAENADE